MVTCKVKCVVYIDRIRMQKQHVQAGRTLLFPARRQLTFVGGVTIQFPLTKSHCVASAHTHSTGSLLVSPPPPSLSMIQNHQQNLRLDSEFCKTPRHTNPIRVNSRRGRRCSGAPRRTIYTRPSKT